MTRLDARTMRVDTPVVFHLSDYVMQHGLFKGVVNVRGTEVMRVELADGVADVLPDGRFWITEPTSRMVVGIPEPVLETIPPDLE